MGVLAVLRFCGLAARLACGVGSACFRWQFLDVGPLHLHWQHHPPVALAFSWSRLRRSHCRLRTASLSGVPPSRLTLALDLRRA